MPEHETMGALIARARTGQGLSQDQLAERLCAAAGRPTVTRHEISRWERGERVPGRRWRTWLARVLELPADRLESAAAEARRRTTPHPTETRFTWDTAEVVTPRSVWRLVHPGVYAVVARPATVNG